MIDWHEHQTVTPHVDMFDGPFRWPEPNSDHYGDNFSLRSIKKLTKVR